MAAERETLERVQLSVFVVGSVHVPIHGVEWTDEPDPLLGTVRYEKSQLTLEHDPFDTPALFLSFARLRPARDDIELFARAHGMLWSDRDSRLSEWQAEIARMRAAVARWETADPPTKRDRRLGANVKQALYEASNRDLPPISCPIFSEDEAGGLGLYSVVRDLLVALWIQFRWAVTSRMVFRDCLECGSPIAAGQNRQFCSNACRQKVYRRRQRLALEMRADGASVRSIAKTLAADAETIKGWLKEK